MTRSGIWAGISHADFSHLFLVDRDKHRIVKRSGVWMMYCPTLNRQHGPSRNTIRCISFGQMLGLSEECPHMPSTWQRYR